MARPTKQASLELRDNIRILKAQGKTVAQIADVLSTQRRTVKNHLKQIEVEEDALSEISESGLHETEEHVRRQITKELQRETPSASRLDKLNRTLELCQRYKRIEPVKPQQKVCHFPHWSKALYDEWLSEVSDFMAESIQVYHNRYLKEELCSDSNVQVPEPNSKERQRKKRKEDY